MSLVEIDESSEMTPEQWEALKKMPHLKFTNGTMISFTDEKKPKGTHRRESKFHR